LEHFQSFLHYLRFEKRFSKHTVTAYQTDLGQFFEFLYSEFDLDEPADANYQLIRSWVVNLMDNAIHPNSVNRKISSLKTFYRFLQKQGAIEENPTTKIVAPKAKKKLPVFLEKSHMDHLFGGVEFKEGFSGMRDQLIMEILYQTGMRLSELIHLKESGIDFHNHTFKVLGKRNKERLIPFGHNLNALLTEYLASKKEAGRQHENLLVTDKGRILYPKFVYRLVNDYIGKVSTVQKKSPHVLRHTFATHLLNNGADLNAIKELLGHSNLSATQVYTHNSFEQLKSIYKLAHPRA